jgi:hypothetical protein
MDEGLPLKKEEPLPPVWPYLLISAALALWVALSFPFNLWHNSDALVPVLVSLLAWTPYYWGGNRIGMLVPLLASPFHSPFVNLVVQSWLSVFALFALMFLMARYTLRRPGWPLAGAAGVLFLLAVPSVPRLYSLTMGQQHYPTGLALGFGGLLLSAGVGERLRWRCLVPGAVLLALGQWVNSATAIVLVPVVGLQALLTPLPDEPEGGWLARLWSRLTRPEYVVALASIVGVFLLGDVARRCYFVQADPVLLGVSIQKMPVAWVRIAAGFLPDFWASPIGYSALLAAAAFGVVLASRQAGGHVRAAWVLAGAGFAYSLPMASLCWIQFSHDWRYWFPCYYLLIGALCGLAVCPAAEWLGAVPRRWLSLGIAPALLALVTFQGYGLPSPAAAREGTAHGRGAPSDRAGAELAEARATHACGGFWEVVPATLMANMRLYEAGVEHKVWPVTCYSEAVWDRWGRMPPNDIRLGLLLDGDRPHKECSHWLGSITSYRIDEFTVVSKSSTVWCLRPTACLAVKEGPNKQEAMATWHGGFYGLSDGPSGEQARWCQRQGRLTLSNPSTGPREVSASMRFTALRPEGFVVWIEGADGRRAVPLVGEEQQTIQATLPPRSSLTYTFNTDAPECRFRGTWMKTHFAIVGFRLEERGTGGGQS